MEGGKNSAINIIWQEIERFIKDWHKSPYQWETEIDIQAEIAVRLREVFKSCNQLILEASYDYIRNGDRQCYSRVCCEPKIYYNDLGGERCFCKPDIVVYDDSDNVADAVTGKNWSMLWVCEIKYQTEDNHFSQDKDWDTEKMLYLIDQNETKYSCCLEFNRKDRDGSPKELHENRDRRFRSYIIKGLNISEKQKI